METNEARDQLRDIDRLRGTTIGESLHAPRWAWPLMGSATIGFFLFVATAPQSVVGWASLAWTAFVVAWVIAIRRPNRARAAPMPWREMRPYLFIALGLAIASNAAVFAFGRVAYLFVGIAFGLCGLVTGIRSSSKHA